MEKPFPDLLKSIDFRRHASCKFMLYIELSQRRHLATRVLPTASFICIVPTRKGECQAKKSVLFDNYKCGDKLMRIKLLITLAALLVAGLFAIQMVAQTTTSGDIAGTVTDPSNAVVSGATVTVTSPDTGSVTNTKTNSTGAFRVPSLKPATYRITITQPGFRTAAETVTVSIGMVVVANIQLQVGQAAETVEVTGLTPLIQTENANLSTAFSPSQVDMLPNGGNDLTAVAQTAPGVVMNRRRQHLRVL